MRRATLAALGAVALGGLMQAGALASPISISNADFSAPDVSAELYNASNNVAPNGWIPSSVNGGGQYDYGVQYASNLSPSWNGQVAYLNNMDIGGSDRSFSQVLGTKIAPNTTYTLSVYVTPSQSLPAYDISLSTGAADLSLQSSTLPNPGPGTLALATKTYTTGDTVSDGFLTVTLSAFNNGGGKQVDFGNVTLDATSVPEPAIVCVIAGASCLGLMSRRRRA